jgi:outer membrane protein assembly factor BamB
VRRAPIVVAAALIVVALVTAIAKRRAGHDIGRATAGPAPAQNASPAHATHGLGAGPPPSGAERSPDVRMLHGGPRHTHRAAGFAPRSKPVLIWSHPVGGPVEAQVTTSADEQTLYVASLEGSLAALNRADGVEQWKVPLGDRAYATPCVAADGTIYAGSDAKKMFAISPAGRVKWSLDTDGDADTAPALTQDGTIVFAAGRVVYSVTPQGHLKWRFAARRKVFTSPAIAPSGRVFFGSQDHRAYAVSDHGTLVWSVDLGDDVDGSPAIGDDAAVFMGTDGGDVVRLDPDTGAVLWRAGVGGFVRGPLSIARDGSVLAGVYGPTPREVRIRAEDGHVVGEFGIQGTGAREFGVHGGALEDDAGTLLFGAQDDDVYAVGSGGDLLWSFTTGGDVDAPVTLLNDGTVVVSSDDGNVYLLRAM